MTTTTAFDTFTKLNYATFPVDEVPYSWVNEPPEGTKRTNAQLETHPTTISDLRGLTKSEYGLDLTGFDTVEHSSSLTYNDYENEETIKSTYYEEITELLKERLGAHRVVIFDHTIRRNRTSNEANIKDTPDSRQPVSRVHVDQTPKAGFRRVHDHTGADADALLKGRARLINVWRPLRGPVKDIPLAVADFRSVKLDDLVASQLIYSPENVGETFSVNYNPNHKWWYLSDMKPNELYLIKCFDSKSLAVPDVPNNGIASLTPHTAFVDERYVGQAVEPRQSIEVRALVFSDE